MFDALTTNRSYRGGMSAERALSIMREDVGKIFDPVLFRVFETLHTTRTRWTWRRRSPMDRRRPQVDPARIRAEAWAPVHHSAARQQQA